MGLIPVRLTVLISGTGSNLQAIIDALDASPPAVDEAAVVRVISNKKGVHGLSRAANAGIPTAYHNLISGRYTEKGVPATLEARAAYDADLADLVLADKPNLVVCAGWMHVLSPQFLRPLEAAKVPIINLHPALPGEYNGANAIQRAFDDFKQGRTRRSGCMIHYVIQEVDMGEPICIREVEMREGESQDQFELRMHDAEHVLIVEGTRKAVERWRSQQTSAANSSEWT